MAIMYENNANKIVILLTWTNWWKTRFGFLKRLELINFETK